MNKEQETAITGRWQEILQFQYFFIPVILVSFSCLPSNLY
jgi:hypothetical protein